MRRGVPYKPENNVPDRSLHRIAHHHGAAVPVGDAASDVGGNRAPLLLVGLKESGIGASLEHPGDLPGEVARVLNTSVQSETPNRCNEVGGITEQEDPALAKSLR